MWFYTRGPNKGPNTWRNKLICSLTVLFHDLRGIFMKSEVVFVRYTHHHTLALAQDKNLSQSTEIYHKMVLFQSDSCPEIAQCFYLREHNGHNGHLLGSSKQIYSLAAVGHGVKSIFIGTACNLSIVTVATRGTRMCSKRRRRGHHYRFSA